MKLSSFIIFVKIADLVWESRWRDRVIVENLVKSNCDVALTALKSIGITDDHIEVVEEMQTLSKKYGDSFLYLIRVTFDNAADEAEFILKISNRETY